MNTISKDSYLGVEHHNSVKNSHQLFDRSTNVKWLFYANCKAMLPMVTSNIFSVATYCIMIVGNRRGIKGDFWNTAAAAAVQECEKENTTSQEAAAVEFCATTQTMLCSHTTLCTALVLALLYSVGLYIIYTFCLFHLQVYVPHKLCNILFSPIPTTIFYYNCKHISQLMFDSMY